MTKVERSAGGVVIRRRNKSLEVLMIDDAYGHVTFPKGHVEAGETWETAAIREIREETGIEATVLAPVGRVEYPIERFGETIRKQVRFFLLEASDNDTSPVAQQEEVRGAFFTSWEDADARHLQQGYANWSWVLPKAKVLLNLYDANMDTRWRQTPASLPADELATRWREALPLIRNLLEVTGQELQVVAPDWFTKAVTAPTENVFPLPEERIPALAGAIEHTLLKPEASLPDVLRVVHEAKEHRFGGVCVNPQYLPHVVAELAGEPTLPVVVVGFPLGATDTTALTAETRSMVEQGAREVDMVLPVGSMVEDDIWSVHERIQAVVDTAHGQGAKVKVIFETHFLSLSQVVKAALVAVAAGADFLKTSTGFAPSGARVMDVAVMKFVSAARAEVKAAGGIKSREEALNFLRFGATRLGTSSGIQLIGE